MKNKLLIICGPTATGKTRLGIKLSQHFKGEIISADSRQVYLGMDIVTGKDVNNSTRQPADKLQAEIQKELKEKVWIGNYTLSEIPIWMLDIVKPDQKFSVGLYQKIAKHIIEDIWRRHKLPIVIGGTGLYIKSLIDKINTLSIPPDWKLREQLNNKTREQLKTELKRLDLQKFRQMNKSDKNNPRRLIRAIEIVRQAQPINRLRKIKINKKLIIGLKTKSFKDLYQRIDERVEKRVKQGAEKEIKQLLEKYTWDDSILGTTIGYKQWRGFFEGKASLKETIQHWRFAEHAYARRQMTWFKKQPQLKWLDIDKKDFDKQAKSIVQRWYGKD